MALKAGRVADFGGSLAEAMEQAMREEWLAVKGVALPDQGRDDRRLLFVAVARGLFVYLKANEDELMNEIRLRDTSSGGSDRNYEVMQLELNL
jgi:hypothetical protein